MARPIQLRYDDVNDGETVIGTYLTDDNLIQQASLKNSGSGEYTRLEIKGDKQLSDNLPTDNSQYATAEPEILLYVQNDSGNWQLRDRVFAEDAGTLENDGTYRNANLWGFQKWVGRQKTPNRIDKSNATITEIVDELLPNGYVAQTPSDDTVPTLDKYTFSGKIDRGIRDLVRDFPVKIWWSPETDGSGNYVVKVQSKGYGDVVQVITFRETEGYSIIEFQEEDKANIVNKVEIEGVDSNDNKVSEIVEDSTSINNHGERYIHRNVGYLESATQAQNIGNDILNPDPSPHARMSIPFQDDNILNASIDIVDERFGIDAVYTVVKQRDFFTEGRTEVELGFEKNRSEERRDRDRELDERNHQLFPGSQESLQLDIDEDNSFADGPDPGESYDDQVDNEQSHDVTGEATTSVVTGLGDISGVGQSYDIPLDGFTEVANQSYNGDGDEFRMITFECELPNQEHVRIRVEQGSTVLSDKIYYNNGGFNIVDRINYLPASTNVSDITLYVESITGANDNENAFGILQAIHETGHEHDTLFAEDRAQPRETGVSNDVNSLFEELDVLGQTVEEILDVINQLKTDR